MKKLIIIGILVLLGLVFFYWQDNDLTVSKLTIKNDKIPNAFKNYKIVQISDLHNKDFGERLAEKTTELAPDLIVLTGDLIDSRRTDIEVALNQVSKLASIAPIYYVNGNHEARIDSYQELTVGLKELGVIVLENSAVTITNGDAAFQLIGLSDQDFFTSDAGKTPEANMLATLNRLDQNEEESFQVLLAHRPELIESYADSGVDMVFSGHAHGGQVRLPFVGGLFAPDQGLLPKYTAGKYTQDDTSMIVSRGLGNSLFPLRVFNRPEIVEVTLDN